MTTEEVVKAIQDKFEETSKGLVTVEQLEAFKTQITDLAVKADQTQIKVAFDKMEAEIEALKEKAKTPTVKVGIVEELKQNMDAIKSIAKRATADPITIKADTFRANIEDNEQSVMLQDIGQLQTRRLSMYDLFPRITVSNGNHNGTITYYDWDEATTVRAADSIAEGAPFPQSTAKWKKYSAVLEKIGDTLPVSAEFYEDAVMFANELDLFLKTNVDLEVDRQIANGDGTGNTLTGIMSVVPTFNPALVSPVPAATFYDLLVKAMENITTVGGAKYMPNFVAMRKSEINRMRLTKDQNDNYIIPPFVTRDGREVDGLVVIEANVLPANQFVLGDSRFAKIYEMAGVQFERGTVNEQFTEDMETLKVRKRLMFLIRNVDRTGFVKVTNITNAIAAITTT